MTDYGDPSLFDVNSEIGIFDLEDAIIEYLAPTAANLMAIKSLSRSWRWGALTAFHWEGAVFCKCKKHMLLNPTKLQKPNAEKDAWCCDPYSCRDFCTCNIPKCLKNDDELQEERIGGYPAFEFLAIDFAVCHESELGYEVLDVLRKRQPNIDNVYFDSWPQDDVAAIRFISYCDESNDKEINNKLLERFGPRNLRLFVVATAPVSPTSLEKCGKLKWLDLYNANRHVNGEIMSAVVKLPQLKRLSLEGCNWIPQESFTLLRDNNKSIENLSLEDIATDEIVEEISHMRKLVSLNLSFSDNVSSSAITSLVKNGTRLESLNLLGCRRITPANISTIANVSTLRLLDVRACDVSDSAVEELATKLSEPVVLKLCWSDALQNGFLALGKLRTLLSLAIDGIPDTVSPEIFNAALGNLTQLQVLDMMNSHVESEHLQFLEKLCNLEVLSLEDCRGIGDEGLRHLRSLYKLRKLNLADCKGITSDGVAHLSQLTEMESLNLEGTKIDDKALQHISGMTKMRWLTLRKIAKITDNGLQFLRGMRDLELLDIKAADCKTVTTTGVIRCIEKWNKLKWLRHSGDKFFTGAIRGRYPDVLVFSS